MVGLDFRPIEIPGGDSPRKIAILSEKRKKWQLAGGKMKNTQMNRQIHTDKQTNTHKHTHSTEMTL